MGQFYKHVFNGNDLKMPTENPDVTKTTTENLAATNLTVEKGDITKFKASAYIISGAIHCQNKTQTLCEIDFRYLLTVSSFYYHSHGLWTV